MSLFKPLKVYLHIFYYNFLTILTYPFELLATVLEPLLEIGFLALFWNMVAKSANSPINTVSIITYFVLVEFVSIWVITPRGLNFANYIGFRVKTGQLSQNLARPIRILPALLAEQRGYYAVDMIFSLLILFVAVKLMGGVTLYQLLSFVMFIIFSLIITFSISVIVGAVSFVTKEINSIRHSVSHLIRLLSGTLIPLTFFPDKMRHILELSPFPSIMFVPIHSLQNRLPFSELIFDVKIAALWSIVLLSIALLVWKINMKKYEAIGI